MALLQSASMLRRLTYAHAHIPDNIPHYWQLVTNFVEKNTGDQVNTDTVKVTCENLQMLDPDAFCTETDLFSQLSSLQLPSGIQLGVPLISRKTTCQICNKKLLIRADRPSTVTIYTDTKGTLCGSHFRKYCSGYRTRCTFTQHYGYHSSGVSSDAVQYDDDWESNQYFLSSQQTAFELQMLQRYDHELLLGQLSYKQKADIYNSFNGYNISVDVADSHKRYVWNSQWPTQSMSVNHGMYYGIVS